MIIYHCDDDTMASDDNKTITLKFYSEVAVPLLLKFEGGVNDERQNEVVANHTGSGWEEISFDFATNATTSYIDNSDPGGEAFVPTGEYGVMTLFVDGPGTTAGTFYIDDIMKASMRAKEGLVGEQSYGLGLKLVRHLVLEMGGQMDINSEEETGTKFNVSIPRYI